METLENLKILVRNQKVEMGKWLKWKKVIEIMSAVFTTDITDFEVFDLFWPKEQFIPNFSTGGLLFVVQKFDYLDFNISNFKPIRGGSYNATPSALVGNHFILYIRNIDNQFFAYLVLVDCIL